MWWNYTVFKDKTRDEKSTYETSNEQVEQKFMWLYIFIFFSRFYLFIFRERGREGEREGEKYQCVVASRALGMWPATQACALDWESNQWLFGLHVGTQSTEPHQPGLCVCTFDETTSNESRAWICMYINYDCNSVRTMHIQQGEKVVLLTSLRQKSSESPTFVLPNTL